MKKFSLLLSLILFCFSACKEIPPIIPECRTQRVVLIEEYTGVQCVNCPAGSERLGQLRELHGNKLAIVSIHAGFFSVPFENSTEDFTLPEGEQLDALTGPVTGYPAAIVNRKIFSGENQRPLPLNSWAGYIAEELCREPLFGIQSLLSYDADTRRLSGTINISPREEEPQTHEQALALTIMLVEDGVTSPQATLSGKVEDYKHKYIFRAVLGEYSGDMFCLAGQVPTAQSQSISFTLPQQWQAENCRLIAFVHYKDSRVMDVLQAHEVSWF